MSTSERKVTVACDFDGTLVTHAKWINQYHVGAPIPKVVEKVKDALRTGWDVWIFTARASFDDFIPEPIENWCKEHIGTVLPITAIKLGIFTEFWDDRAVGLIVNTGELKTENNSELWWNKC